MQSLHYWNFLEKSLDCLSDKSLGNVWKHLREFHPDKRPPDHSHPIARSLAQGRDRDRSRERGGEIGIERERERGSWEETK